MVAFLSAGLGLGHEDFDGYRGRLRSTRVLWWLQVWQRTTNMAFVALKALNASEFKCTEKLPACKNQLCDNMIDKDFEESGDDTADEYESDIISGDNA